MIGKVLDLVIPALVAVSVIVYTVRFGLLYPVCISGIKTGKLLEVCKLNLATVRK